MCTLLSDSIKTLDEEQMCCRCILTFFLGFGCVFQMWLLISPRPGCNSVRTSVDKSMFNNS